MKKCYAPDGVICDVTHYDSESIWYYTPGDDRRFPADNRVEVEVHNLRVQKWGPIDSAAKLTPSTQEVEAPSQPDVVTKPSHYQIFDGTESIEVIAMSFTQAELRGFCFGNVLKYRLRAGNKDKDKLEQDIAKADFYKELYDKHKHLCREA